MGYGELEATSDGNRYKVITVGDRYYYIDLDHNPLFPLFPLFPFLVFFLPVKGYELKNLSSINIIYHEKNSTLLISGLSLTLSRFLKRIENYSTVYIKDWTKVSFLIMALVLTLLVRYFFQKRKKLSTETAFIWIKPQSSKRFVFMMLFLLFLYGALILIMYFCWIENGLDLMFLALWCFVFYSTTNFNSLLVKSGRYKVKIKRSC